ncbi:MAG: hypothetical protein L0Y72_27970 [Gemmataceae bacterium]|nr:hypothetical protein [Gemmataceae bacterium]MCI0742885.1 hypothetical protein [Gemmataceae bacterium]
MGKTKSVAPHVRHMLVCEDVRQRGNRPTKIDIFGLVHSLRPAHHGASFPLVASFCVFVVLTAGRGVGAAQIVIVHSDRGDRVFEGQKRRLKFGSNPLEVTAVRFRIVSCVFPELGLYSVEFRYNEETVAHQPLLVKGEIL